MSADYFDAMNEEEEAAKREELWPKANRRMLIPPVLERKIKLVVNEISKLSTYIMGIKLRARYLSGSLAWIAFERELIVIE